MTQSAGASEVKGIAVLGATGSIGVSTLDVIARHPDRYRVVALTANTQVERLFQQCQQFQPAFAVMTDADCARQLELLLQNAALTTRCGDRRASPQSPQNLFHASRRRRPGFRPRLCQKTP